MKRAALILMALLMLLMMILTATSCELLLLLIIQDLNGQGIMGVKVSMYDNADFGILDNQFSDSDGKVSFKKSRSQNVAFTITPPEGYTYDLTDYSQPVPAPKDGKFILRKIDNETPPPATTSTTVTSKTTLLTLPITNTTSDTTSTVTTSTSTTTTTPAFQPFTLLPDQAFTHFDYETGTTTAELIQTYFQKKQMALFKNSDGASQAYMKFDLLSGVTWDAYLQKFQAILKVKRTPETVGNSRQATVYVLDMAKWQEHYTSTPPRLAGFPEIRYNLNSGKNIDEIDITEILEVAVRTKINVIELMIDTPDGTQMQPGEEIVWETVDSGGTPPSLFIPPVKIEF